jgi:hypothetical protein
MAIYMYLLLITLSIFYRDLNKLLFLVLANTLEGTRMRSVGVSSIQFGKFYSNEEGLQDVFAECAWEIFDSNKTFFDDYLKPIPDEVKNESVFKATFKTKFFPKQDSLLQLVASISGVTRSKDRLYELIANFRNSTQNCWEDFVASNLQMAMPGADRLKEFLAAPRRTMGVHWRRLVLLIADRVRDLRFIYFYYLQLFMAIFACIAAFVPFLLVCKAKEFFSRFAFIHGAVRQLCRAKKDAKRVNGERRIRDCCISLLDEHRWCVLEKRPSPEAQKSKRPASRSREAGEGV